MLEICSRIYTLWMEDNEACRQAGGVIFVRHPSATWRQVQRTQKSGPYTLGSLWQLDLEETLDADVQKSRGHKYWWQ